MVLLLVAEAIQEDHMTTVYKVVYYHSTARALHSFGVLWGDSFHAEYEQGVKTLPPNPAYPQAWLWAFDNLMDAMKMAEWQQNAEVWKANATATKQPNGKAFVPAATEIELFWLGDKRAKNPHDPGSILCADITLLERLA